MYRWFENEVRQKVTGASEKLSFSYEPTVTPGVSLGKIALAGKVGRSLIRTDVRPEGVRLHFPLSWQQELSDWLGVPPADAYRLKSNWVHQPSIGVAVAQHDPYFIRLVVKVLQLLQNELDTAVV